MAYRALAAGGTMPAALNAANEVAVRSFLDGHIRFTEIARTIGHVLDSHQTASADTVGAILEADRLARQHAHAYIERASVAAVPAQVV